MARVDNDYTDDLNAKLEQEWQEGREAWELEKAIELINSKGLVVVSPSILKQAA